MSSKFRAGDNLPVDFDLIYIRQVERQQEWQDRKLVDQGGEFQGRYFSNLSLGGIKVPQPLQPQAP
jgi:hypothetical protein